MSERTAIRRKQLAYLLASLAMIMLPLLFRISGDGHVRLLSLGSRLPEICLFKRITGLQCPTCGFTRSFISIAGLRLAEAVSYNAAAVLLYLFLLAQIPYRLYLAAVAASTIDKPWFKRVKYLCCWVMGIVLAGGWIYYLACNYRIFGGK